MNFQVCKFLILKLTFYLDFRTINNNFIERTTFRKKKRKPKETEENDMIIKIGNGKEEEAHIVKAENINKNDKVLTQRRIEPVERLRRNPEVVEYDFHENKKERELEKARNEANEVIEYPNEEQKDLKELAEEPKIELILPPTSQIRAQSESKRLKNSSKPR